MHAGWAHAALKVARCAGNHGGPLFKCRAIPSTSTATVGQDRSARISQNLHNPFTRGLGLVTGAGAGIGTLIGGFLSDAVARWDRRWYVWLPALGLVVTGPFYALALVQPTWHLTALFLLLPGATSLIFVAPILATVQNLAEPRMRATATALLTLVGTLFGLALGPVVAGVISDRLAGRAFGDAAVFADVCPGGVALASAEAAVKASCRAASAAGIQHSSLFFCGFFFLAAIAFLVAARSIRRDLLEVASGR